MSQALLKEFINKIINEDKSAVLLGQNKNDVAYALNWIRLNNRLKNSSVLKLGNDKLYRVTIKFSGSKRELIELVKDRFGTFIEVQ